MSFVVAVAAVSLRLREAAVEGASAPGPGVLTSPSSSVMSECLAADGVLCGESICPRTCCREVLGSARIGDEACVIWSSNSEAAMVEPGDLGGSAMFAIFARF